MQVMDKSRAKLDSMPFSLGALRSEQGLAIAASAAQEIDAMAGDTMRGLLAWNGGGNPAYPAQVLAAAALL